MGLCVGDVDVVFALGSSWRKAVFVVSFRWLASVVVLPRLLVGGLLDQKQGRLSLTGGKCWVTMDGS